MSSHLDDFDFDQYIKHGKKGISKIQYKHFTECAVCQANVNSHRELNELLTSLTPQKMPVNIYESLIAKLAIKQPKPKADWFFVTIISLLIFIMISLVFFSEPLSSDSSTFISELLPNNLQINWDKFSPEPLTKLINKMKDSLPGNEPLLLFLFVLIVILIYYLLDSLVIKPRLKLKT